VGEGRCYWKRLCKYIRISLMRLRQEKRLRFVFNDFTDATIVCKDGRQVAGLLVQERVQRARSNEAQPV
jgi:hypothetical protein